MTNQTLFFSLLGKCHTLQISSRDSLGCCTRVGFTFICSEIWSSNPNDSSLKRNFLLGNPRTSSTNCKRSKCLQLAKAKWPSLQRSLECVFTGNFPVENVNYLIDLKIINCSAFVIQTLSSRMISTTIRQFPLLMNCRFEMFSVHCAWKALEDSKLQSCHLSAPAIY